MNVVAEFALPPCVFEVSETFRREITFDAGSIRDFATMSGDTNPLHHDEAYASTTRFSGLIASGGHCTALMMGAVADYMTKEGDALGLEFSFRFLKAVPAGADSSPLSGPSPPSSPSRACMAISCRWRANCRGRMVPFSSLRPARDWRSPATG
jgi:hypothetical protein